jgi:hypothetical protein
MCALKSYNLTHVECPRLKKVPTVTGLCPAATSRLVIRSMSCSSIVSQYTIIKREKGTRLPKYGPHLGHVGGQVYTRELQLTTTHYTIQLVRLSRQSLTTMSSLTDEKPEVESR